MFIKINLYYLNFLIKKSLRKKRWPSFVLSLAKCFHFECLGDYQGVDNNILLMRNWFSTRSLLRFVKKIYANGMNKNSDSLVLGGPLRQILE